MELVKGAFQEVFVMLNTKGSKDCDDLPNVKDITI